MITLIKQLFCTHTYDENRIHIEGSCLDKKQIEIAFCTKCEKRRTRIILLPEEHKIEMQSSIEGKCLKKRRIEISSCTQCGYKKTEVIPIPENHNFIFESSYEDKYDKGVFGFPLSYTNRYRDHVTVYGCTICKESKEHRRNEACYEI